MRLLLSLLAVQVSVQQASEVASVEAASDPEEPQITEPKKFGLTDNLKVPSLDGIKDKIDLEEIRGEMGEAASKGWTIVTEVKDGVAEQTAAALESKFADMQSMAFSFLKLSEEMVNTLREMIWNFVVVAILLVLCRYLPVDVMLVVVTCTFFFGPFLLTALFRLLGFLFFLATWAPQLVLFFLMCTLFAYSHLGQAAVNSCGFDAAAMKTVPGFNLVVSKLRGIYLWFKGILREKCCGRALDTFVELEEAAFAKISQEPLTHEAKVDARLNAMEKKLNHIVTVVLNVERQIVSGKMSA